jgi:hypothetical protein
MHKLSAVMVVLLAIGLRAQAQDAPKVEVFTGYSFVSAGFPFSSEPAAGNARGSLHGWNFSAAVNANRWVGMVADFGGYYGSPTKSTIFKPANCVLCTGNVNATLHNIHTFAAGPQVSARAENMTVFGHVLAGGAHLRADFSGPDTAGLFSDTDPGPLAKQLPAFRWSGIQAGTITQSN